MSEAQPDSDGSIPLSLTRDEAVVLFEFLARTLDDENGERLREAAQHDGELWGLTRLLGYLDRTLSEPFLPDYQARVEAARQRLVEKCGPWPWDESKA
ncbi:hypothetical protein FFK22_019455 [Mycobacterium sp. KBS0706]|uniref:hypothetical protein n=1 Tax=Mycobacterium sp. KBS0706 TaxID=2578109 RepID=UPI00110FF7A7|nr:hypothetical protein [Mycobacterium sp. KBS0706]TSD87067.1 hypothetical protein FFK22_019455 [Mycobacterium sp. KBS0706]